MKQILNATTTLVFVGAVVYAGSALAYTGQKYEAQAKISMARATQIALKAQPGKIADSELEREGGGSGLRYSFDIRRGSQTHEVGVDAKTGKILENSVEGPNPD